MTEIVISPYHPWLAPLSGFSDLPFRLVCRRQGCGVTVTEMVSAKGLFYNFDNTMKYLETTEEDSPLVVQLFGEDPKCIGNAVSTLLKKGYKYFDLNAGCPVKKVTKTGSGAALLKDLKRLKSILMSMIDAAGENRVGVKIRLGWNKDSPVYLEIGEMASKLNIAWIGFHPRYAKEGFSGKAKWECIKKLKENTDVPVIASGDLFSAKDGLNCIINTKADSVMFARGALKDPLIFKEYKMLLKKCSMFNVQSSMVNEEKLHDINYWLLKIDVIKTHIELIKKYGRDKNPIFRLRGILARYLRGFDRSKFYREMAVKVNSWEEVNRLLQILEEDVRNENH